MLQVDPKGQPEGKLNHNLDKYTDYSKEQFFGKELLTCYVIPNVMSAIYSI